MIIVDSNEAGMCRYKNKPCHEHLREKGIPVDIRPIEFCDYIVTNNDPEKPISVGVERKEAKDFVNSIKDGRIFNQAFLMSLVFPKSFILVEGYITDALLYSQFPRSAFIGALVSLGIKTAPYGMKGSISVITMEFRRDTIDFLARLHEKVMKGDLERLPRLVVKGKKEFDKRAVLVAMLQAIPGVGLERAKRIAERYESIKDLVERATINDLVKINGIGFELAKKIISYIR